MTRADRALAAALPRRGPGEGRHGGRRRRHRLVEPRPLGRPESNAVLKRIADTLPIAWDDGQIKVGDRTFAAENHALILIYPNPLNPERYVVLNSGFTFREYDYLNNARQVPKLPDWAVIDLRTPPDSRFPGKVVAADFFGEDWELQSERREPESDRAERTRVNARSTRLPPIPSDQSVGRCAVSCAARSRRIVSRRASASGPCCRPGLSTGVPIRSSIER